MRREKRIVLFAVVVLLTGSAAWTLAEAEEPSVTESFRKLEQALSSDPNISPEVKEALNGFGRAVSKMEEQMRAVDVTPPGELQDKITEWFASSDRQEHMDKFFGTAEKKGLLDRLHLYGDFRLRFETTTHEGSSAGDPKNRSRARYRARFRLGGEYQVGPTAWVGARVTTGSRTNQQSPHQTFDHNFSKWEISLDRVYLHWAPFKNDPVKLGSDTAFTTDFWLGKFSHGKTFKHTGLAWDSDVQPEGIAMHNVLKGLGFLDELQLNLAGYVLTENKDQQDASMAVMQLVFKKKFDLGLSAPLEFCLATGFYDINDTDTNSDGSMIISRGLKNQPTLVDRGEMVFQSHYEIWDNIVELKYKGIEFLGKKRPLTLTFDYLYNTNAAEDRVHDAGKQNKAYGFFASFGKAKKKGDWRIGGAYVYVERDAVYPGVSTDDWAVIGNMKGGSIYFDYALWDKTVLRLWGLWDYPIETGPADSQDNHFRFRAQIDIKF